MAKLEHSKTRTVLELLSHFELADTSSSPPPSFSTLAISTLSDSETLIYAGTASGALLLLSTDPNSNSDPSSSNNNLKLLRLVVVSDSPVHSIHVVSQIGRVLVVSEGYIYVIDSLLLQPVKKLGFLKGVSAVARRVLSGESGSLNLIGAGGNENASVSQRILKKLGGGIRSNGVKAQDLESNSEDNSCIFAVATGKRILLLEFVVGSRGSRGDRDVDGSFLVTKEIQCVDEGVKAMVWLDDAIVVGTIKGYSLISCVTGQNVLLFSLPDVSSLPFLKLLLKNHKVLLLVDNVGIVVDAQGQPVFGSLVFCHAPDSIGEFSSYVVVVKDGKIELYHKRSGVCVQVLSVGGTGVGQCVIADEEGGSGRFLAAATPSKVFFFRKISPEEQIKDLLRKKNYEEAISLVVELEGEGEMTKDMLSFVHTQVGFLLLFDLHFEEAVDHFLVSETMQPSEIFPFIMRDPNRWSLLVPRNRYWGLHPPPAHIEDVVEDGCLAIQRAIFLRKAGVETAIYDEFLLNPPSRADLLELAFKNFIRYLKVSRDKDLSLPVREGVDTLLMYLYRSLNCTDDMEKLASSENNCIVEELETLLEESGHLRTLAFLYANKGMSSKALAIWRLLARNYSSGLWKESVEENDKDSSTVAISGRKAAAIEASKILNESSDQDLVLQHLGWISEVDQELAVQVLTSERRTNHLSPDDVIAALDPRKVEVLQRYFQWLIEEQGSNDTQFHTLYALSLAKSALEILDTEIATASLDNRRAEDKKNQYERNPIFETPVRERLQIFLHSSDLYEPEEVLELIGESELWLEKAILYRKLGQEILVLQILALKLEDSEAAEQYCAELGRPDAYMQLLDMYLDPQNGKEPMFKAAVRLLHNHGESLDPLQVLERLSPDMPLQLASETILRMLRARLHHHRQGKIVHNLSHAVDVDVRLARLEERARHVQISDESLCDSCHARLGTKLFAMYPDDSIVCYKCFRRQGESTSVTGRNFKRDALFKPGWLVSR
ncbi:hypothetical protein Ancab_021558 [Ancistrocladus abbreviatus]